MVRATEAGTFESPGFLSLDESVSSIAEENHMTEINQNQPNARAVCRVAVGTGIGWAIGTVLLALVGAVVWGPNQGPAWYGDYAVAAGGLAGAVCGAVLALRWGPVA